MEYMRKIEVSKGQFILYNDAFFVKSTGKHIVWTTNRADAKVMNVAEANEIMEKNNKFLRSGS